MDGTLVGRDLQIPAVTRAAIAAARGRGVRFVIVTGRMYQSAAPFAAELGLNDMPVVAYNGALLKEFPSEKTLFHEPMPVEMGRKLAAFCEAHHYHLQAYVDDKLYVASMDRRTEEYQSIARVPAYPVGSIFLWLQEPSTKMLVVDDPDRIPRILREIRSLLGDAAHVVSSYPTFVEVTSSRVTKATGLERVASLLGVDRSEVMAVGDAMNDVPMLAWVGVSFAMGTAVDAVKRAANHVTERGPGDGVAEALERMGLA